MNKTTKALAVAIILLAVVGLAFIVDSAINLLTSNNHDVAKCESVGGSWDGGCWYAGKLVDVDELLEDLYGDNGMEASK